MGEWDVEISDGNRSGCLIGAVIAAFMCAVVVILWIVAHGRQLAIGIGSIMAVVSLIYFVMMRTPRLGAGVGTLPTPIADVKPGLVHTAGLVGFHEQPRSAPFGGPACVFYRVVVESDGQVLFEGRSADDLSIGDGTTAHVMIHLDGATWRFSRSHEVESSPSQPNEDVVRYLGERGLAHDRPLRARVEWIAAHELVFVRGIVRERSALVGPPSEYRAAETMELEMRAGPGEPLVLGLEPLAG